MVTIKTSSNIILFEQLKKLDRGLLKRLQKSATSIQNKMEEEVTRQIYSSVTKHTGALEKSVTSKNVETDLVNNRIHIGIYFEFNDAPHARTHVGNKGTAISIEPRTQNYLTVPLSFGPAYWNGTEGTHHKRVKDFPKLQKVTSKSGKSFLILKQKKSNGKWDKPIFVFSLRKEVRVTRRINANSIRGRFQYILNREINTVFTDTISKLKNKGKL